MYTTQLICKRVLNIKVNVDNNDGELGNNNREIENNIHVRRLAVVKEKLMEVFVQELYPEFEYEVHYYATTTRQTLKPTLSAF